MPDEPSSVFRRPTPPPPGVTATAVPRNVTSPAARTTSPVDDQNLPMGFTAGLAAAAVGAGVWALITVLTNFQIGWMAVGVGFLVGWAVRVAGKGSTPTFGVLGAALALGGCLAGNLLTVCVVASRQFNLSVVGVVARLTPAVTLDLMSKTFSPMDLLFYAIAVYEGYRFSILRADTAV
jgi:hypothetical protein